MLITTSTRAIWDGQQPYPGVIELLQSLGRHSQVAVISNHAEPPWFARHFGNSCAYHVQIPGRQSGTAVKNWAQENEVPPYRVLVLGASRDDVMMATNCGAVLVCGGWCADEQARRTGIAISMPNEFEELALLFGRWGGQRYWHAESDHYTVDALCNASSHSYTNDEQRGFGQKVARAVKYGTPELNKILTVTAGSLLRMGVPENSGLVWGVYPSSSGAGDEEVLSDFTHRLRTTVSRVHFAKIGEPLFVRHRAAPKRSAGEGGDRNNPTAEVESLHLNPFYSESNRLLGKYVVVVDDLTTYGLSMGVAAGMLRAAGARAVHGVALGKLGNRLGCFDVTINSDPFAPIPQEGWSWENATWKAEELSDGDQEALRSILNI